MPDTDPRLYLVTPVLTVADAAAAADALSAALGAADVAAVLLRLAPAGERDLINIAKKLAPVVQAPGAALLIEGFPEIVARGGADGAHLVGPDALRPALPGLKPRLIAGVGGLRTRHDAMVAAELGADYVMFGEPGPDGRRPPFETVVERVQWWAEVFETPCVGCAESLDEIAQLSAAGADFVAVGEAVLADPRGPAVAAADAARRLAREAVP
ncbi:thiamine phosphate synthase [Rhodovulum sp. PH10]|uniref:thiamine phosphate synthase n=1 Tax=Rhodovulum sp. PH10 TaxID=1187851 RepID=UPI00058DE12C|nr:thiamine phosphate synthase [Rhodovulum sp. PH10]